MRILSSGGDLSVQLNSGETLGQIAKDIANKTGKDWQAVLSSIKKLNSDYVKTDPDLTHIGSIEDGAKGKAIPKFKLPEYCSDHYSAGDQALTTLSRTVSGGKASELRTPTSPMSGDATARARATIGAEPAGNVTSTEGRPVGTILMDIKKLVTTQAKDKPTSGKLMLLSTVQNYATQTSPDDFKSSEAYDTYCALAAELNTAMTSAGTASHQSTVASGQGLPAPAGGRTIDDLLAYVKVRTDQLPGVAHGTYAPDIDYSGRSVKNPQWSRGDRKEERRVANADAYVRSHDEGGQMSPNVRGTPDPREVEISRFMNNPSVSQGQKDRLNAVAIEADVDLDDLVAMTRGEMPIPEIPTRTAYDIGNITDFLDDPGYVDGRVAEAKRNLTAAKIKYSQSKSYDAATPLADYSIRELSDMDIFLTEDAALLADYQLDTDNPDLPQNELLEIMPKLQIINERELQVLFTPLELDAHRRILAKYKINLSTKAHALLVTSKSLEELQEKCELTIQADQRLAQTLSDDMKDNAIAYLCETYPHLPEDSEAIALYREFKAGMLEPDDSRLASMTPDEMHSYAKARTRLVENGVWPNHPDYASMTTAQLEDVAADRERAILATTRSATGDEDT